MSIHYFVQQERRGWLRGLRLGFIDDAVSRSLLALLEALDMQISLVEAKIAAVDVNDERG
ncbi:MAG: hypothetical protein ACPLZY_00290 [Candidatus Norongarragalinales archaeon]